MNFCTSSMLAAFFEGDLKALNKFFPTFLLTYRATTLPRCFESATYFYHRAVETLFGMHRNTVNGTVRPHLRQHNPIVLGFRY